MMKFWMRLWLFNFSSVCCLLTSTLSATAQILPDSTLPNSSSVTTDGNTSSITGGTQAGGNLFHSFEQFSIPTGGTAYFDNPSVIQNIFSRVTGKSISNIDGLIRANDAANLFLINPNGIIFGPNASLNIGGSFLGSTANSVNFADGTQFSAIAPQPTTLLTINRPIGLDVGSRPGTISIQGTGHSLDIPIPYTPILGAGGSSNGLRVIPGKTLALVGGDVSLEGGILTAPSGRIEIGSTNSSTVNLNSTSTGWRLDYAGVQNFQNIRLSQKSLLDVSGIGSSFINLVGKQIWLVDGSIGLLQNQSFQLGGNINVNATELLELSGTTPDATIPSGFHTETLGGDSGDITVSTKNLIIQDGAAISSNTFTGAQGGNIILNASDSTKVIGFATVNPTFTIASGIGAYTLDSGKGGTISINTGQFIGLDGGTVISATLGTGKSGDLVVNANQGVELSGFNPFVMLSPTQLAVATFNIGDSGDLIIKTPKILLQNGGNINSYTLSAGKAGNITINAPDSIEITRAGTNRLPYDQPFGISSYAAITSETIRQLLRIPPGLSGASGNITISTGKLTAMSNILVNVSNFGTGRAGNLEIDANTIFLDSSASITAASLSGEGGNISLKAGNLQLQHGSSINATASDPQLLNYYISNNFPINLNVLRTGNGGNITINTDTLVALENSDITANAIEGRGGNIKIDAQGVFRSLGSDISASSQFGINGAVQINTPFVDFTRATSVPVAEPKRPEFSSICQSGAIGSVSEFINVGTSGIPASSSDPLNSSSGWKDNAVPAQASKDTQLVTQTTEDESEFIEAQGWKWNPDGTLSMTLEPSDPVPYGSLSKPPCQQVNLDSTSK